MATGSSNTPVDKSLYQFAPPAMAFDSAGSLWVADGLTGVALRALRLVAIA